MVTTPKRHDMVTFTYRGKERSGEVRRIIEGKKSIVMMVKLAENKYRSYNMAEVENLCYLTLQ